MANSKQPLPQRVGVISTLLVLSLGLYGCTGSDPDLEQNYPFPSISDRPSVRASIPVDISQVESQIHQLLAKDRPSPDEVNELTRIADEVLVSAANRIGMTPQEFEQMTPQQVADLVARARMESKLAVQVGLKEIQEMSPKQRALVAQSAQVAVSGLLTTMSKDAQTALGHGSGTVRIGVNELGGYAASAAYLWVYLLKLAGYNPVVYVGSGLDLANRLNTNELDITFEAVPELLESDTNALGVWSEGRLNVQGRAGLDIEHPQLAGALQRFALDKPQMHSLAAVVKTRGVAEPVTQEAAVQLWLVDHPELLTRLTGQ